MHATKKRPRPRLDALPDPADFRDLLFIPTLIEVPTRIDLKDHVTLGVPILDQGSEGACTGFGLATVVHSLLRRRRVEQDCDAVSPRMLYEMARRYDEWEGEDYDGSSARGAMKGWHKHGICSDAVAPYAPGDSKWELTPERAADGVLRPLGAYFRVNPKDLVAMHAALAETKILFATAVVHAGWDQPDAAGLIIPSTDERGGHAFAVVAYDADGFWIQNSWGEEWGRGGFAKVTYDDWLENAMDVWVARLGAPVKIRTAVSSAIALSAPAGESEAYAACDVLPHVVSIGNDGRLRSKGQYGTSQSDVERVFRQQIPGTTDGWTTRRVLLYAHGGLVAEDAAIARLMEYRPPMLANEVYPVALVWKTDYWTTLKNILRDAVRRRRPEGFIEYTKDFLLDRLDDALEPLARALTGKLQWDEMKENARLAIGDGGALDLVAAELATLANTFENLEIHVVGHSAGSILLGPLVRLLTERDMIKDGELDGRKGLGLDVASCNLWAPACTLDLFRRLYLPGIDSGAIHRFALYTLTDAAEQDDNCANVYHKSLLYLVSNALERRARIPRVRDGEPVLGMAKFVGSDADMTKVLGRPECDWVLSPNDLGENSQRAARATSHGGFDDDPATLRSTLKRIIAASPSRSEFVFTSGASRRREKRQLLSGMEG
ncbi:MAG TPA: C1 family peptidase [Thermoanaerobaculales bacterium]|nr:C1 family peptidase [Thermoanaerobaculales bacterium]HQP36593.1 C1 family peptidase [Polyangiaceae bacterium]